MNSWSVPMNHGYFLNFDGSEPPPGNSRALARDRRLAEAADGAEHDAGQGSHADAMKGKAMKVNEGHGIQEDKAIMQGTEGQGSHADAVKGKAMKVNEGQGIQEDKAIMQGTEGQGSHAEAMKGKMWNDGYVIVDEDEGKMWNDCSKELGPLSEIKGPLIGQGQDNWEDMVVKIEQIVKSMVVKGVVVEVEQLDEGQGISGKYMIGNAGQGSHEEAMEGKALKVDEDQGIQEDKAIQGNEGQGSHVEAMMAMGQAWAVEDEAWAVAVAGGCGITASEIARAKRKREQSESDVKEGLMGDDSSEEIGPLIAGDEIAGDDDDDEIARELATDEKGDVDAEEMGDDTSDDMPSMTDGDSD
jgi:hypothetical protein